MTLQTISIVLTGLTLSVAAIYYTFTLRYTRMNMKHSLETRQAQLFMPLYDRLREIEFAKIVNEILLHWKWEDYNEFSNKYGPDSSIENYSKMYSTGQFFEGIGVMVKRELIDPYLVDDLLSGFIIRYWEKMESVIKIERERMNWPQYMEHVEYLYDVIRPIVEKQHPELKT